MNDSSGDLNADLTNREQLGMGLAIHLMWVTSIRGIQRPCLQNSTYPTDTGSDQTLRASRCWWSTGVAPVRDSGNAVEIQESPGVATIFWLLDPVT